MSNVLLTGGTGFLGKFICQEFLNNQVRFDTLGRHPSNNIIAELGPKSLNFNLNYETVVHCAGKAHLVPKNALESKEFFDVNVEGTKNLLKALEAHVDNLRNFVFISTVSVYGLIEGNLITEDHPLHAKDPYGRSKIICEELLIKWCDKNNVVLTILRLPLLIGKDAPGNLGAMINGMKKGFYFNVDRGQARKSMVLAEDIAEFIPKVFGVAGIFNLTDGYHPSFKELSCEVGKTLNLKPKNMPLIMAKCLSIIGDFLGRKFPIDSKRLQKIISNLTFDDRKARELIEWKPRYVLNEINNLLTK